MHDYGERMSDQGRIDGFHVGTVQIRVLYVVQQRVAPIQPIGGEIDGQTVGPSERDIAEHDQIRAVGVRATDVGRPVPFGEEYVPAKRPTNGMGLFIKRR